MENNIKYLASKSIVLSDEDEKKYIKMLGCESLSLKKIAKNKLFEGNIKLVYSQAQKWNKSGIDIEDLIQAGFNGLKKSIDNFDWNVDTKFATYAVWNILHSIQECVKNYGEAFEFSVNTKDKLRVIRDFMNNFLNENGCEASIKEILDGVKKEICVDEYEIIKLLNMVKKVISFEKKLDCDDENSISNFIADENSVTKIEEKNIEFILKEIFNNKELDLYGKVLQLRSGIVIYDDFEYIGPYPLIICADILKKTKDEIRFLEVIAYKKIRENNNYKKFIKLNSKE